MGFVIKYIYYYNGLKLCFKIIFVYYILKMFKYEI